jgi:hypothetical protein
MPGSDIKIPRRHFRPRDNFPTPTLNDAVSTRLCSTIASMPQPGTSSSLAAPNPATAARILHRQDELRALSWLLAQRRLYSRAKRWNYVRVFGIGIIALGAPIVTVIDPALAVVVGAVAGAWIFLARTIFLGGERRSARQAANIQDAFDTFVFDLPSNPTISSEPERIADILHDDDVEQYAQKEHLLKWYSIDPDLPLIPAVAISQQSNLAYSERLLRHHANIWVIIGAAWGLIAVVIGIAFKLTLAQFLMGIVLPVLPAVLDARELWHAALSAANDRLRLSDSVAQRIRAWPSHSIKRDELRNWQDQLYILRRDSPLVPDVLYRWTRSKNERAMSARASELAEVIHKSHLEKKKESGDGTDG